MSKIFFGCFVLSACFFPSLSKAYDQVELKRVVPLTGKKSRPTTLRIAPDGGLWVLNQALSSLQKISTDGKVEVHLKPGKSDKDLFRNPVDFSFCKDLIVVADAGLKRIAFLSAKAEGGKDSRLTGAFPFEEATAVSGSQDDVVAVASHKEKGIQVFSVDGILLHTLFPPEEQGFKNISSLSFGPDGTLWALDRGAGKLHRFSNERKWLGVTQGLDGAQAVDVDPYGYAYISMAEGRWKEVDREGNITGTFGTKGKAPGQMSQASGIAAWDGASVWIIDSGNNRLQEFLVLTKEKNAKVPYSPAAFIQVRSQDEWNAKADGGLIKNDDILLINKDSLSLEWVNAKGEFKAAWNTKKNRVAARPCWLAADPEGAIWVLDRSDHAIKKLSETGDGVKIIGQKGKKEGSLKDPSFLTIRNDFSFVVVDRVQSRIQVLGPTGLFLFPVGARGKEKGQFLTVSGVAANSEKIAVADNERKAVLFYDSSGKFVFEIANKEGKAPVWRELAGIAADPEGRFYVLDAGAKRVRIFNPKGQFYADFNCEGEARRFFVDSHRVVILSDKKAKIYDVHLVPKALQNVAVEDAEGDVKISWDLNAESISYKIFKSSQASFELLVTTVSGPVLDPAVIPGATYSYVVQGLNQWGFGGPWSDIKSMKASRRKNVSLVSISNVALNPVFTAAFKSYVDKPVGSIDIQNYDAKPFRNIKLSLALKEFTDFPSEKIIDSLEAGEKRTVPVTMTFNDRVLELTENTPVQTNIRLTFFEDNNEKTVSQNAPLMLYSRNAIAWSDKARLASFVTPRDMPIVEFSRAAVRAFLKPLKSTTIGRPLTKAALFSEAVRALGISYVPDPSTPYKDVSNHPEIIDYVQFPRETLRRRTGDCDDTTALLASLLESVGAQVALVDTPGHIFLMANLEENDPGLIGLPIDRFIDFRGTYWVPIETTQIEKGFPAAWQSGIAAFKAAQEKGQVEFVVLAEAFEKYPPLTLREKEKDLVLIPEERVKKTLLPLLAQLQAERYKNQLARLQELIAANPEDPSLQIELAMAHIEGGKTPEGKMVLASLLRHSSDQIRAAAYNNLGNIAYLAGNYAEADKNYGMAAKLEPADGGIVLNQARLAWRQGHKDIAKRMFKAARGMVHDWREYTTDIPVEILPK